MKKLLTAARYLALFAVGLVLLYYAFRGQDFSQLKQALQQAEYRWVGLSLIFGLVAYWSRAVRWRMLLQPLGYNPRMSDTFIALMVGYIANLALPRLGEVLRCTLLNRLSKTPVEACLGTVVAERVFDLLMLVLCLVVTLFIEFDLLSNFLMSLFSDKLASGQSTPSNTIYWVTGIAAAFILALTIVFVKYQHRLLHFPVYARASNFAKGVAKGLISVRNLRNPWAFVGHTLLIWLMYYGMTYIVFFALPQTAVLGWQAGLAILVIGGLGMSAPVQGGIGAFHWVVSHGLMLYGVSELEGLSLATILHGSQTLFVILAGGLCLLWSIVRLRNATKTATVHAAGYSK